MSLKDIIYLYLLILLIFEHTFIIRTLYSRVKDMDKSQLDRYL